jgi:hypothetical protein
MKRKNLTITQNMEIKKTRIRVQLLLNDIVDYNKAAFMEIRADNSDVLNLWHEYNSIRDILNAGYPLLFSAVPPVEVPKAYLATRERFHNEGDLVFKPEHFDELRLETEKILSTLNVITLLEKEAPQLYKQSTVSLE